MLLDLHIAGVTPALLSTKELWSFISNLENPSTTLFKLGDSFDEQHKLNYMWTLAFGRKLGAWITNPSCPKRALSKPMKPNALLRDSTSCATRSKARAHASTKHRRMALKPCGNCRCDAKASTKRRQSTQMPRARQDWKQLLTARFNIWRHSLKPGAGASKKTRR